LGEKATEYGEGTPPDIDVAGEEEVDAGAMLGVGFPSHRQRLELQFLQPPKHVNQDLSQQ
jgi:hypothetical protein